MGETSRVGSAAAVVALEFAELPLLERFTGSHADNAAVKNRDTIIRAPRAWRVPTLRFTIRVSTMVVVSSAPGTYIVHDLAARRKNALQNRRVTDQTELVPPPLARSIERCTAN